MAAIDVDIVASSIFICMFRALKLLGAKSSKEFCAPDSVTVEDKGPIPPGEYTLFSKDLDDPAIPYDILRNYILGDWGDWRITLKPCCGTETFGRSGFFIHGGARPGSAGCIDIGGGIFGNALTEQLKNDILGDPDGVVDLTVQ